ncbi:hypothetical protein BBJ28_00026837 [Nothophytophthora sp. Chile5]|nr:hypothetical protein BBJ28_00026837 [Nothophytophthora sp. Chile5]
MAPAATPSHGAGHMNPPDPVDLPAKGGPDATRCPTCVSGARVHANAIPAPDLDLVAVQTAIGSLQHLLGREDEFRRVQADYLALQMDHAAVVDHAAVLHNQLRAAAGLAGPFVAFAQRKYKRQHEELEQSRQIAAEAQAVAERHRDQLSELDRQRVRYYELENLSQSWSEAQQVRIHELEIELNAARSAAGLPSIPAPDGGPMPRQKLFPTAATPPVDSPRVRLYAAAAVAAVAEADQQRERGDDLETRLKDLRSRFDRLDCDRTFEVDRLRVKIQKAKAKKAQLKDLHAKTAADLRAVSGARDKALADATDARKWTSLVFYAHGVHDITSSSQFSLRSSSFVSDRQIGSMRTLVGNLERRLGALHESLVEIQTERDHLRSERDTVGIERDHVKELLASVASVLGGQESSGGGSAKRPRSPPPAHASTGSGNPAAARPF